MAIPKNYFWMITLILVKIILGRVSSSYLTDTYPEEILKEARLDTAELIRKYNYSIETHFTKTEDNYIVNMHRIPREGGKPVLLMHGLLDSSATWIVMGPWSALGYYLYDNGYDVWMGNARGNRYSHKHATLDPNKDKEYWKFSFHEIGYYDLPAMIDYILQKTGQEKLTYFGHSQGTTTFFVMSSLRPEYNEKVYSMHALNPVAFMKHMKTQYTWIVKNILMATQITFSEIFPHNNAIFDYCLISESAEKACLEIFYQIVGKETKEFNMTMLPALLGQVPAGCSFYQPLHYIQLYESDRFCQYDYGFMTNMKMYGNHMPPDYPLEKIEATVILYYTSNDFLSSEIDIKRLAQKLPNAQERLYLNEDWNHVTLLWGINARKLAHVDMLKMMQKYE